MIKKVLSINHSDSTGKTGIQSDLGFFQSLNVFGFTVITGINATPSAQLERVDELTIKKQLETVFATGHIDSIKLSHIYSLSSIDVIKYFVDTYQVKHLIYEVSFSELEKEITQTVIKKLVPIIVITSWETESIDTIEASAKELLQYHDTDIFLANTTHSDSIYLLEDTKVSLSSIQTDNLAAFLAAELAIHQTLSHILPTK